MRNDGVSLEAETFDFDNTLQIDCSNLRSFQVVSAVVFFGIGIYDRANMSLSLFKGLGFS